MNFSHIRNTVITFILCCLAATALAQSSASNVRVEQHDSVLLIMYDLASKADIEAYVSFDGGTTWRGPLKYVKGAVGKDVLPEKDKIIIWDIVSEVGYVDYDNTVIKIVALGSGSNVKTYSPDNIEMVYVAGAGNIKDFYIGKYEVTQAQWQAVMGSNPSRFKGDNLPVESVSWDEVQDFITRLNQMTGKNYRLPTSAQWEFAARGGTADSFCRGGCKYSGSNNVDDVAWYWRNSGQRTHEVGTKSPNELGIYDMSGNVWEWCEGFIGSHRVFRGGSWYNYDNYCRVAYRGIAPGRRGSGNGFRVVL